MPSRTRCRRTSRPAPPQPRRRRKAAGTPGPPRRRRAAPAPRVATTRWDCAACGATAPGRVSGTTPARCDSSSMTSWRQRRRALRSVRGGRDRRVGVESSGLQAKAGRGGLGSRWTFVRIPSSPLTRRAVLREPIRRRPVPALEPARRLARGRAQLALRAGVAARRLRSRVSRIPGAERRVARLAIPAAGRSGRDRDDEVLPPSPSGASAAGQTQPAPEARVHGCDRVGRARGAHRLRGLQADAAGLADDVVRRISGGALLALLDRVDLRGVHDHARDSRVRRGSRLAAGCGWDGGSLVRPGLWSISRVNDWVGEKLLYSPTRLARTYDSSERSASLPSYFISRTMPMLGDPAAWRLRVDGLVAQPVELSLDDLMRMPRVSYTVKHHCVEGWSAIASWHGVPVSAIVEQVRPTKAARYISFVSFDADYSNGWDMASALHPQTILAYGMNDNPLPAAHGAPLRLYSPTKLGYKLTKYLVSMTFMDQRPGGYWEDQGYPWFGGI